MSIAPAPQQSAANSPVVTSRSVPSLLKSCCCYCSSLFPLSTMTCQREAGEANRLMLKGRCSDRCRLLTMINQIIRHHHHPPQPPPPYNDLLHPGIITFLLALKVVKNPVGILSGLGSPYIFSQDFRSRTSGGCPMLQQLKRDAWKQSAV